MKIVQAFGQENREGDRFEAAVRNGFAAAKRRFRMRALLTAMVIALLLSAMTLIMWDAVHDVASGQLPGGSLAAFVFTAGVVPSAAVVISGVAADMLAQVRAKLNPLLPPCYRHFAQDRSAPMQGTTAGA